FAFSRILFCAHLHHVSTSSIKIKNRSLILFNAYLERLSYILSISIYCPLAGHKKSYLHFHNIIHHIGKYYQQKSLRISPKAFYYNVLKSVMLFLLLMSTSLFWILFPQTPSVRFHPIRTNSHQILFQDPNNGAAYDVV